MPPNSSEALRFRARTHVVSNLEPDFSVEVLGYYRGSPLVCVPAGSPSRGGDVTVYVKYINQPSLPAPFHSVLVSISVFVALSTAFIP